VYPAAGVSAVTDPQRRLMRQHKAVRCAQLIKEKLGGDSPNQVEDIRVAALSAIAEARSVWDFLISKGLASVSQRETFLDKAFDDLLGQIESHAAALMVKQ
jgi:hypothetical protein